MYRLISRRQTTLQTNKANSGFNGSWQLPTIRRLVLDSSFRRRANRIVPLQASLLSTRLSLPSPRREILTFMPRR